MNKPASIKVPHVLPVIKGGEEHGVILPAGLLARLGISGGESLEAVEGTEGLTLGRQNSDFARQMEIARDVMKRRRTVLRELAK